MNYKIREAYNEKNASKSSNIIKISKKEYGRLSHLINSNHRKWLKDKINSQIIDDVEYYFIYNNYDDFTIIKRRKI